MNRRITEERRQAAIKRLDELAISELTRQRAKFLLNHSMYAGAYADFLLSKDPQIFRYTVDTNAEFGYLVKRLGLNRQVLRKGIQDEGVLISLEHGKDNQE